MIVDRARVISRDILATLDHPGTEEFDLARGATGTALLFAYAALAFPDERERYRARATSLLEGAFDQLAARVVRPSLFHGFAGVAWAADHIRSLFDEPDLELNDDIDQILIEHVEATQSPCFDLVSGLVGFGVYALERVDRPSAERCLERIIARLAQLARRDERGVVFWTPAELLPDSERAIWPRGYHDFGLAHGGPGVIAFLARCAELDRPVAVAARELLLPAVEWLLEQRRVDLATVFPATATPEGPAFASRSGWCYGDGGVALAITRAARASNKTWDADARVIARHAADRPFDATKVRDASLCHGAAGLVQIYRRLSELTGDPRLHEAAQQWLARTMELPLGAGDGLFEGVTGTALVLLGATTHIAHTWDRILLVG